MEGIGGKESWGGLGWWEKVARAVRKRWVESRVWVLVVEEEAMEMGHGREGQEESIVRNGNEWTGA